MLDIKDKMDSDLSVSFWCLNAFSQVLKGLAFMELGHLKGSRVLPLGIAIALVKLDNMVVISWDFKTILVLWCHVIESEFSLIGHTKDFLVMPCNALKALPAVKIK